MTRSYEIGEQASRADRVAVEIAALRPNSQMDAANWRRALPNTLAGITGEVPGAELDLSLLTDEDGIVDVDVVVSAGSETDTVAREIASALAPVAETVLRPESATTRPEWPLIPVEGRARLGFVAGSRDALATGMPWQEGGDAPVTQLVEDLAGLPGEGVRIRLRAAEIHEPRWELQLFVVTEGGDPSLRTRAAVRRRFAGLQVGQQCDNPVRLQVASTDLPAVFALPVAAEEPLAGARTAPAAPIHITPPRRGDTEAGLRIGHAMTGGGRPVPVQLTTAERLRHVHVLGRTGTGKSSALAGMVHGLAARGEGALVADPHGTLCDRILAELPEQARERIWIIRCGDVGNAVPINPLAESDPARRDIAIADLCATFQYLFDKRETGIVGPRFIDRVAMTLRALAAVHGTRASLLDVPLASADDAFMTGAVKMSGDERLQTWWKTSVLESRSSEHGQVLAWVNSKFQGFANTAALRAILGSGADAIDFTAALDDGRIILLDLSKAELGEQASRLLGYLYLARVWAAALQRERRDRPFTVIVDEAHTLISGALTNMLAEGRKFGLSVVLAHQYLEQLDDDLRPAVDGNVATTMAFRCAVRDAIEIGKRFGGLVETSTLVTQPDLTAVCLRTAMPGPAHPHSLFVDHNDLVDARCDAELDAYVGKVLAATYADLVDPYLDITAAAAEGVSNITALPRPPVKPSSRPDAPRPGLGDAPGAPRPRATEPPTPKKPVSFLDEWLAKRENATRSDAASTADTPSSSVDPDQLVLDADNGRSAGDR
jgi:hypothetical protein